MTPLRTFVALALLATFACRREPASSKSFTASLRCGMTRDEVARVAREKGYGRSDATWLQRTLGIRPQRSKDLVDLTFREGRLVAIRETTYVAQTKRIEVRTRELCAGRKPGARN